MYDVTFTFSHHLGPEAVKKHRPWLGCQLYSQYIYLYVTVYLKVVQRKALLANVINRLVLDVLRCTLVEAFGLWLQTCGPRRVMISCSIYMHNTHTHTHTHTRTWAGGIHTHTHTYIHTNIHT